MSEQQATENESQLENEKNGKIDAAGEANIMQSTSRDGKILDSAD